MTEEPTWRDLFQFRHLLFDITEDKPGRYTTLLIRLGQLGDELEDIHEKLLTVIPEEAEDLNSQYKSVIIQVADTRWQLAYLRFQMGRSEVSEYKAEVEDIYHMSNHFVPDNSVIKSKVRRYRRLAENLPKPNEQF